MHTHWKVCMAHMSVPAFGTCTLQKRFCLSQSIYSIPYKCSVEHILLHDCIACHSLVTPCRWTTKLHWLGKQHQKLQCHLIHASWLTQLWSGCRARARQTRADRVTSCKAQQTRFWTAKPMAMQPPRTLSLLLCSPLACAPHLLQARLQLDSNQLVVLAIQYWYRCRTICVDPEGLCVDIDHQLSPIVFDYRQD